MTEDYEIEDLEEEDSGYPEFDAPAGFEVDPDAGPKGEFQAVATIRRKPDGRLCLVALDGARFEKTDGDEVEVEEITETVESGNPTTEKNFSDRLTEASKRMMG